MRSCFNQFLICFVMARRAFIIRGIFTTATHPFSPASSRSVSLLVSNNIQTVNRWWILGSQGTSTSLETFHQRRDSLLTRQNQFTVKKKKKKNAFLSACIATTFHPFGHLSPGRVKRKKKKRKKFDQMYSCLADGPTLTRLLWFIGFICNPLNSLFEILIWRDYNRHVVTQRRGHE